MRWLLLVLTGWLLAVPFAAAEDPCSQIGIDHSVWDPTSGFVSLSFTTAIQTPQASDHVVWALFDQNEGAAIPVDSNTVRYERTTSIPASASTSVSFKASLDPTHQYLVSAINVHWPQCHTAAASSVFARVNIPKAKPALPTAAAQKTFVISPAHTRSDADLYLAGLVNGSEGAAASYTADVKAQFRFLLSKSTFGSADSNAFRSGIWVVPNFDLKASTDPASDGNSVTMGVAFPFGHALNNKTFTWVDFEPAAEGESDTEFNDINAIARLRAYFLMRVFGSGRLQFLPQPFVGLEAGGNVRSAAVGAYAGGIVRPTAGLDVYLNLFKHATPGRQAFVESEYIRRWPLLGEPMFTELSSGALQLASVGTNPRDNLTTKLEYDFADYFGVTIQYVYGALPPVFTKVDNQYTIGLVLKTGLAYKPK